MFRSVLSAYPRRAGHAVRLGERSQPDKAVVEGRRQQLALVHEIGISFVEQQQRVTRQGLVETLDIVAWYKTAARIIRVCEIQNPRRFAPCRGKQRLAIGRTVIAVRDAARAAPIPDDVIRKGGIRAAGRERRITGSDERAHRKPHQIVDARAHHDLFGTAAVLLPERVAQIERFGIAVPRKSRQLFGHRGDRLG